MEKRLLLLMIATVCFIGASAQNLTKQEKGYFNLTEVGYLFSENTVKLTSNSMSITSKNDAYALSIRNINGMFISPKFSLGIGVGLDGYTYSANNSAFDNTFLLFMDTRYYLKNEKNSFFAFGDLGSSVAIADNIANGLMTNVGIGYKFMIAKRSALNFSSGYVYQQIKGHRGITSDSYSSLSLRVGLLL